MATFRAVDGWTTEDDGTGGGKSATIIVHAEGTEDHTAIKSAFRDWLAGAEGPENSYRQIEGDTSLVRKSTRCQDRGTILDADGNTYYYWECTARYGPESTPTDEKTNNRIGDVIISGDTAGGTKNVKYAINVFDAAGDTDSNEAQLIGFTGGDEDEQSIDGVDIEVGLLAWEETHYIKADKVTDRQRGWWTVKTGTINDATWRGADYHEAKFKGVRYRFLRDADDKEAAEVTYRFEALPTRDITFPIWDDINAGTTKAVTVKKAGWDYVSQPSKTAEVGNSGIYVTLPTAVYVQQAYEETDFRTIII